MTDTLVREAGTVVERYAARTPGSRALFERATGSLPGGSTRTTVFSAPYPPYVASATGPRITDVDGNIYLDLIGNYTSLILGHAHPAVVAAVEAQVRRGSAFAAPTETEIALAEELKRRLPSIERLRFTNSGTEATMLAIRAARAATGRPVIARFEKSYHGTHDLVSPDRTGIPAAIGTLVVDLPWADPEGVAATLEGREDEIAAIIIEPIQGAGGVRAAGAPFLKFLREYTDAHGMLLIFDEVIAFRAGPGGVQGLVGVRPDLTTLGKIIGGGYPLAAFGGAAEVMDRFDARRPDAMSHGGTFNGNPVGAAAGLATLAALDDAAYAHLERLAARLTDGLGSRLAAAGSEATVEHVASLFQIRTGPAGDPADTFLELLCNGYWLAPRGMGAISLPMTEADVDGFVDAAAEILTAG
jgi:glutamate-1-semialdehyde 2,1-aminomutase